MTHPLSIRFRHAATADRLKSEAMAHQRSASGLAEELIEEGLRMRRHPLIVFRAGPAGRRAAVLGGADVAEVVAGIIGGDVDAAQRMERAMDHFGLRREQVEAGLAYYAEHTDEIDAEIAANNAVAEEAEALWRRQHDLLTR